MSTSDAVLAEHHKKKVDAVKALEELRNGGLENLSTEDQQRFDSISKAIDDATAAYAEREGVLRAAAEREATFKRHEGALKESTGNKAIGLDQDRRREADPERIVRKASENQALALQAWMRYEAGMELSDEHRAACRTVGINPGSREMALPANRIDYGAPAFVSRGRQHVREVRVGLDVATSGAGLETIPEGFMSELEAVTLAYSSVRGVCRVIRTASGNAMPWPKVDDTGNTGVLLAEATTFGTSVDPTFSAVTFNAYKYSSKPVFVSYEILRDSAFNLASIIAGMLGERLGRIEGSETTVGNGSDKPLGIVAAAGTGVTSALATAFTADEIIDLVHSLDPSNRMGGSVGFMFHDTALKYIRKFKDANGKYLWQPGMMSGEPDMIYGQPYTINQHMEPLVNNLPVTANKHVLYGDFSKFVIRDVATPRFKRLDERYADTDQVAFIAFKELDSDTIKASALKVLLQA